MVRRAKSYGDLGALEHGAMTESKPLYRFVKDFEFFDCDGTRLYRTWREGAVVSDPKEIEWLIARTAPVERIET